MTPGFSMMGSGIYSQTITREIVCKERCEECPEDKPCENYWDQDFETDDWGNVDEKVTCKTCGHDYTYSEERE